MKGVNAIGLLDFTDFGKWLSTWGGYAGAIAAIIGLLFKWEDLKVWWRKKHPDKTQVILQRLDKMDGQLKEIKEDLAVMQDDIVVSQLNDLKQLYGEYKQAGFATLEQKSGFFALYDRYHGLGRNTLSKTMRQEIEALPDRPPTRGEILFKEYGE